MNNVEKKEIEDKIKEFSPINKKKFSGKPNKLYLEITQEFKDYNVDSVDYTRFNDFVLTSNNNISIINEIKENNDHSSSPNKNKHFESTETTTYKKKILGNSLNRKFKSKATDEKIPNEFNHMNLIECQKKDNDLSEKKLSSSVMVKNFNQLNSRLSNYNNINNNLNDRSNNYSSNLKLISICYNGPLHRKGSDAQSIFSSKLFSN